MRTLLSVTSCIEILLTNNEVTLVRIYGNVLCLALYFKRLGVAKLSKYNDSHGIVLFRHKQEIMGVLC